MLSTAMAAMVNFFIRTSSGRMPIKMGAPRLTRNLQLGQGARPYEDVTRDFTSSRDRKSFATKGLPCRPHGSPRSSFETISSSCSIRRALGLFKEFVDQRLADAACGILVDRLHRLAHRFALLRGELDDLALAALLDLGERVVVLLLRLCVAEVGRFLHRLGELVADIGRQIIPELLV